MQSRSPISRRVSLLLASLITIFATSIAHAQETSYKASFNQNKEAIAVNVLVGQSRVINFDRPVGRFSVSNPEIAEAVLVTPDQVLVNGKAFGQVNFIAWEQSGGQFLVFDVYVRANLSLIDSQIRALFPKDDIRLSQANGSVVISGSVSNATTAAQVQSVVEAAGFKTVNMLESPVKNVTQVQLQVRVAEVNRNKLRDYGTSLRLTQRRHRWLCQQRRRSSTIERARSSASCQCTVQPALNLLLFNRSLNTAAMLQALQTARRVPRVGRAEPDRDGRPAGKLPGRRRISGARCSDRRRRRQHRHHDRFQGIWRSPELQTDHHRRRSHPSRAGTRSFDYRLCQWREVRRLPDSRSAHSPREDRRRIARRPDRSRSPVCSTTAKPRRFRGFRSSVTFRSSARSSNRSLSKRTKPS